MAKIVEEIHARVNVDRIALKCDEQIQNEVNKKLITSLSNELITNKDIPKQISNNIDSYAGTVSFQLDLYVIDKELYRALKARGGYRLLRALSNMNNYEINNLIDKHVSRTPHNLNV